MVNLANSRGFSLPETKLFEQKFLDLCLSRTPDHPTYSAVCMKLYNLISAYTHRHTYISDVFF